MSRDVTKLTTPKQASDAKDAASRLKSDLMQDALGRMFGEDGEKQAVPGNPRVIFALANHAYSGGWDRAKVLQREMFQAAAGSGLAMKFAFYGPDDAVGVRRCRITTRWITDAEDMAGVMDRAECNFGCYINIRDVLAQAVKENEGRPLRAVIIVGDAFHDDPDGLDEAAICANQLRRAGTGVLDPAGRRSPHRAQASVLGPGLGRRAFSFRSDDTATAIREDVGRGVRLCRRRRAGCEDDGRASGNPAVAISQAGADANHRGARSRAGKLRHQGVTALNKLADQLKQIVKRKDAGNRHEDAEA